VIIENQDWTVSYCCFKAAFGFSGEDQWLQFSLQFAAFSHSSMSFPSVTVGLWRRSERHYELPIYEFAVDAVSFPVSGEFFGHSK